jgi:hypothetical protein
MSTTNRTWDIDDSGSSAAAVSLRSHGSSSGARAVGSRPAPRARGLNQASTSIVLILMIVTSVMAIVDLYLLTTALPH